jgi:chemosensory pili system protein ChpC
MNAAAGPRDLSALLVPVAGELLVVPGAVVAEIIKRRELQRPPGAPDWLLGTLLWHHEKLPVLSFEALNGNAGPDPGHGSRIVILTTLADAAPVRNYAILAQGVPHLLLLTAADVESVDAPALGLAERMKVRVHGQAAAIPDFDYIEQHLAALPQAGIHVGRD